MNRNEYNTERVVKNKISIISFVCCLLVIWIHTYNLEMYGIDSEGDKISKIVWLIETFWDQIVRVAVPTFFLLSGYLFFRSFSIADLIRKLRSRVRSILIPYIVWCTLYYLYYVILSNVPFVRNYVSIETVNLSLMDWLSALWPKAYYTLWFLQNLLIFIAITPVFYILLKNRKRIPVGSMVVLLLIINGNLGLVTLPSGLDMFAVGSYLAINHQGIEYYRNKTLTGICFPLMFILFATKLMAFNNIGMMAFLITLWFSLDYFDLEIDLPWWIKITFFIYVFHDFALEILENIWLMVGGVSPLMAFLDYLFMPWITVLISVLVASIMRHNRLIWNVLSGWRSV